jgi:hypothetical protein
MKSCLICNKELGKEAEFFCSKQCYYRRSILNPDIYQRKKWTLSSETKKHQSEGITEYRKLHSVWSRGLTKETDERLRSIGVKVSKTLTGKKREDMMGENNISHRDDVKRKKRESIAKFWSDNSEEGLAHKERIINSVNRSRKVSNTSIEIKVQDILDKIGIQYKKTVGINIGNPNDGFQKTTIPDQYVEFEDRKICLFEDGSRWHNIEIDLQVKKRLINKGYECYRFSDVEIDKDWLNVVKKIKTVFHIRLDEDIVRSI